MRRILFPLVALAAAFAVAIWTDLDASPRLLGVGRLAVGITFLIAWRLRRGRVAAAVLLLGAAHEALIRWGGLLADPADELGAIVRLGVGVLVPLNLGLLALSREFWVASRSGWIRFGLLALQGGAVWATTRPFATPFLDRLRAFRVDLPTIAPWLELPPPNPGDPFEALGGLPLTAAAFAIGGALALGGFLWRRTPLESGLFAALVAAGWALLVGPEGFFLVAGVLVLAVALVENAVGLAFHDGLTGLPARRALEERLAQLGRTYSLAMVDIDHFKKLNDRHGHEVGDQVLRLVATRLRKVGAGGEPFRYGGEEFTLVFAGKTAEGAADAAEALRREIADTPFTVRSPTRPKTKPKGRAKPSGGAKSLKVTVSIGLAERGAATPTPETVMKAADKALYKAKRAGRNRLTVA